jgi:hypothetical protein
VATDTAALLSQKPYDVRCFGPHPPAHTQLWVVTSFPCRSPTRGALGRGSTARGTALQAGRSVEGCRAPPGELDQAFSPRQHDRRRSESQCSPAELSKKRDESTLDWDSFQGAQGLHHGVAVVVDTALLQQQHPCSGAAHGAALITVLVPVVFRWRASAWWDTADAGWMRGGSARAQAVVLW